ncbi:GNAT family N-acetyltransferase [Acidovorax sp. NPDC077693]|uniref:GNAT family N-acetyltransferase n=1 Tax=unclassified Acidovorax TaxID=2684926 RepID=UPI0037C512F1
MQFLFSSERSVTVAEFSDLMGAAGWGTQYDEASFHRSYNAYPLVIHARDTGGLLVGYVSAFSDGVFSTMLGELVVRPSHKGLGIGRALMQRVEQEFPGTPVYIKALGEAKHFFEACGYRKPRGEMTVLFKKNFS